MQARSAQALASNAYSIDGVALRQSIAQVSEPNVTFERDEALRKLELREIDIHRKDKELHHANIETLRLQKENKLAQAEIQNLRDRNESLQQALMNSRLLSANARNDAEHVLNESRIRELEAALSAAINKIKKGEAESEMWQEKWKAIDVMYQNVNGELNSIKDTKNEHRAELEASFARVNTLQALMNKAELESDNLRQQISNLQHDIMSLRDTMLNKQAEIDRGVRELAEAKGDVAKLKQVLAVRAETNTVLRAELEEMNGNTFVISKVEMNRFKKLEVDFKALDIKLKEVNRSLMLQMDVTAKIEADLTEAKETAEKSKSAVSELTTQLTEARSKIGTTGDREKILKREVIKLRKEKQSLADELVELQNDPLGHDAEAKRIRDELLNTTKAKHEETEEKMKALRGLKMADESVAALRNRIAFLLEQHESTSSLAAQWHEQKAVFKAEIEALHNTNTALRSRLANVQGNFINRYIPKLAADANYTDEMQNAHEESKGEVGHPFAIKGAVDFIVGTASNDDLGEPFDQLAANTFPHSVESFIERSLFDTICAFSSGTRQQPTTNRKSESHLGFKVKKNALVAAKQKFKVKTTDKDENKVEIVIGRPAAKGNEAEDASAAELLVGMQINPFLNFCQSRPAERVAGLYAEKICALLNFTYNHVQDMIDQLGAARLELAKVTSKMSSFDQRMQGLRLRYSVERTAKQKNSLKYVREQMRLSDMRILMQDLFTKSIDLKDTMELSGAGFLDANKGIMSLLHETEQVCKELSLAGASSGTTTGGIGALEIRIPDSEIEDETLYSLITLLAGSLDESKDLDNGPLVHGEGEAATLSTGSGLTMMHSKVLSKAIRALSKDYLSRVVLINLKGNNLTDISCHTLARILEKTPQLRMLDLRENKISDQGAKVLFDAIRKNPTIMYVTQRQNGFMIEGHREIQAVNGKRQAAEETRAEMDRLLDTAKFPLRVDVRYNEVNTEGVDPMFEQVDYSLFQTRMENRKEESAAAESVNRAPSPNLRRVPGSPAQPYGYSDSPRRPHTTGSTSGTPLKGGAMTSVRLDDSPYMNSHTKEMSAMEARMNAARISWSPKGMAKSVGIELQVNPRPDSVLGALTNKINEGTMPPRPKSASATMRNQVAIGAGSMAGQKDEESLAADEHQNPLLEGLRSRNNSIDGSAYRGVTNHTGLIDLIENQLHAPGKESGSLVDGKLRGDMAGVGDMVDSEIRDRLANSAMPTGAAKHGSKDADSHGVLKSVKERILSTTKRVYNNKSMFKEMQEPESLLDIMKKGKFGKSEKVVSTIPAALEKGGGQISKNTASTVRSKLIAARNEEERISINGSLRDTSKRPMSAPQGRLSSKKLRDKGKEISTRASDLMMSLQKLNPAVLF